MCSRAETGLMNASSAMRRARGRSGNAGATAIVSTLQARDGRPTPLAIGLDATMPADDQSTQEPAIAAPCAAG